MCTVNICIEQCSNVWFFDRDESIEKGQDNSISIKNVIYFTFLSGEIAGSLLCDHRRRFTLFVCLFATYRKHRPTDSHIIVRLERKWYKEQFGKNGGVVDHSGYKIVFARKGVGLVAWVVMHDWKSSLMDFILVGKDTMNNGLKWLQCCGPLSEYKIYFHVGVGMGCLTVSNITEQKRAHGFPYLG